MTMPPITSKYQKLAPDSPLASISTADVLRFERIAQEMILGARTQPRQSIGTLREKILHATIKKYICEDMSYHEITVADMESQKCTEYAQKKKITADVCIDGHIYEVQTGGFFPLREKIKWYMYNTDYAVTVVAPIAKIKHLCWIDPVCGHVSTRRRSPKTGKVQDLAKELYWISELITDPKYSSRLEIKVMLLEIEEYRIKDGWGNDGKRGSNRYDRIPISLMSVETLGNATDYAKHFLTDTLVSPFTAADYTRATTIRGKAAYSALHILEEFGLIKRSEKIGRAQGYILKQSEQ